MSARETLVERRLRAAAPPRPMDAERRAWHVVRAAHAARAPVPRARRGPRLALAGAVAALAAAALALTPAGARVGDWIDDVVSPAPAPRDSLAPPSGRLLVVGGGSAWVVEADGARRRLGPFDEATWSPGSYYVAGVRGHELVALEPDGDQHWVRPAAARVHAPRWSPDGFRIAYRAGGDLRVAFGDNKADWLLARHVGTAAPAWKPLPAPYEQVLAYPSGSSVRIVEVDTRELQGVTPPEPTARAIWWALGGHRLVTVTASSIRLHTATGRPVRRIDLPAGWTASASALAPRGRQLALIVRAADGRSRLLLVRLDRDAPPRQLLDSSSGFAGLAWATDGSWLVVGRPQSDQWLFVPPRDPAGLEYVRGIRTRFGGGAGSFPVPAGWCYSKPVGTSTSGYPACLPGSER